MSLKALIDSGVIKRTDASKKYTIDGEQKVLPIYRIPLRHLYYNDQNGRISTAYQQYLSTHDDVALSPAADDNNPSYNKIFEDFIFDSNPMRMKQTIESIRDRRQEEPGVVLDDGRVIDGNRRFTALRRIEREGAHPQHYFEAAILDLDISNETDKRTIKRLELDLQMGKEDREDYDPIDRIFDVYNTVEVQKLMTAQEYATSIGQKNAKGVNQDIEEAKLIADYLDFINAPRTAYYLAKQMKLDGPMHEVRRVLQKAKALDDGELKSAIFALLTKDYGESGAGQKGDLTRTIRRQLENLVSSSAREDWKVGTEDDIDVIYDACHAESVSDSSQISQVLESTPEVQQAVTRFDRTSRALERKSQYKGNLENVVSNIAESLDLLQSLDSGTLESLSPEQTRVAAKTLDDIISLASEHRQILKGTGYLL